MFAMLADFFVPDEEGAAHALFRSPVDGSQISDPKHTKHWEWATAAKRLDVVPQADNNRQAVYYSSKWWKNEQNTCKQWDVECEEKDDFIAGASFSRETVNQINQALACLAVVLYNFLISAFLFFIQM